MTVSNQEKTQCAIWFIKFKVPFNAISDTHTHTHTHTHREGNNQV